MNSVSCKNCGKKFDQKRSTAQFCSTKCRIKYSRKVKAVEPRPDIIIVPKKVAEVLRKDPKCEPPTMQLSEKFLAIPWVKQIMDYCDQQSITPQDLIESHQNKPSAKSLATSEQNLTYLQKRQQLKLGKHEPKKIPTDNEATTATAT